MKKRERSFFYFYLRSRFFASPAYSRATGYPAPKSVVGQGAERLREAGEEGAGNGIPNVTGTAKIAILRYILISSERPPPPPPSKKKNQTKEKRDLVQATTGETNT